LRISSKLAIKVLRKLRPDLKITSFRNTPCGTFGCVYQGPEGTIIKIEHGQNEAILAKLLLQYPELRVSTLPQYFSVTPTGVLQDFTDLEMFAIHREDLRDIGPEGLAEKERDWLVNFGTAFDSLSRFAYMQSVEELLEMYEDTATWAIEEAKKIGFLEKAQQLISDLRQLLSRGLVLCDIGPLRNWGIREATGQIVIRDTGCLVFSREHQVFDW